MRRSPRGGFTLVELLVVIAIIAMLIAIMLPTLHWARESARRVQCKNNLSQIATATHLFHEAHGHLPPYFGVFPAKMDADAPTYHGYNRTAVFGSWFVHILPFIGQEALWNQINDDIKKNGSNWDAYTLVRQERVKVADATEGFGYGGTSTNAEKIEETRTETTVETVFHGPEYETTTTKSWVDGDKSVEVVQIGWAKKWFGHTEGEDRYKVVVNEGYWQTDTVTELVKEAYTTEEEITRWWNELIYYQQAYKGSQYGWEAQDEKWETITEVSHFKAGGIKNFHHYSFDILQCPSDPSILSDGLSEANAVSLYPEYRPDLEEIVKLYSAGRWGVTSYIPNWNAFTNGDGYQAPFNAPITLDSMLDGASNTILLGEGYSTCDGLPRLAFYNAAYYDCFGINGKRYPNTYMYQAHPQYGCNTWRAQSGHLAMNVAMADGSVKTVNPDISRADQLTYADELSAFRTDVSIDPVPYRLATREEIQAGRTGETWSQSRQWEDGSPRPSLSEYYGPPLFPWPTGTGQARGKTYQFVGYMAWDRLLLPSDTQFFDGPYKNKYRQLNDEEENPFF